MYFYSLNVTRTPLYPHPMIVFDGIFSSFAAERLSRGRRKRDIPKMGMENLQRINIFRRAIPLDDMYVCSGYF